MMALIKLLIPCQKLPKWNKIDCYFLSISFIDTERESSSEMEGVWSISVELEFASQPQFLPPVLGDEVQHPEEQCMVQYSTVQYSTVQYSTVQYNTVQYSADTVWCTWYTGDSGTWHSGGDAAAGSASCSTEALHKLRDNFNWIYENCPCAFKPVNQVLHICMLRFTFNELTRS